MIQLILVTIVVALMLFFMMSLLNEKMAIAVYVYTHKGCTATELSENLGIEPKYLWGKLAYLRKNAIISCKNNEKGEKIYVKFNKHLPYEPNNPLFGTWDDIYNKETA